jgi:hypothetical protein
MKKLLLALLCLSIGSAHAQSVRQSGNVTPGHIPVWLTTGVIGDGGTAAVGILTALGVTFSGNGICQNSGPVSGAYNQICLGTTQSGGGTISVTNVGGATGGINFQLNGVSQAVAGVTLPVTINDFACFASTAGNLKDCGSTLTTLAQYHFFIGNASNVATDTALAGDCVYGASGIICTKTNNVAFATVATSGSATDLASGTLAAARMAAFGSGDVSFASGGGAGTIAANAVTNAKLAQAAATTVKCNATGSLANDTDCTGGVASAVWCQPVRAAFFSGTNVTDTLPTCNSVGPTRIELEMVGGGGGGAGSGTSPGAASAGGTTCWNTSGTACSSPLVSVLGGGAGVQSNGASGAGGTTTGCVSAGDLGLTGGAGGYSGGLTNHDGGYGGAAFFGQGGPGGNGGTATPGGVPAANTGAGGGGGSTAGTAGTGSGGGAGGYCRKIITAPAVSYVYTIGAAGTGGTLGTSGAAGANGAAGMIIRTAYWQ